MSKVVKLHPELDTVQEAFDDAIAADYDEIIIIGLKGSTASLRWSHIKDSHKLVGLLEQAKLDILYD